MGGFILFTVNVFLVGYDVANGHYRSAIICVIFACAIVYIMVGKHYLVF